MSLKWNKKPEAVRSLGSQAGRLGYKPGLLSALRSRNWEGPDAGRRLRGSLELIGEPKARAEQKLYPACCQQGLQKETRRLRSTKHFLARRQLGEEAAA